MLLYLLFWCQLVLCNTDWVGWGGSGYNARYSNDSTIKSSSINSLETDCQIDFPLGISATPTVVDNIAYFPTWNGSFIALDSQSCSVLWSANVTRIIYGASHTFHSVVDPSADAASIVPAVSKTTPQMINDTLIFGTMLNALVVGLDKKDGSVKFVNQLDTHPFAMVTMSFGSSITTTSTKSSGTKGSSSTVTSLILVGTDSMEEAAASTFPDYKCCSFVGHMFALQLEGGNTTVPAWNISMIPNKLVQQGWSGAPISGSQPATLSNEVFIATGNGYTTPQNISNCYAAVHNSTSTWYDHCVPPKMFANSVLCLNVLTGAVKWSRQLTQVNARAAACGDPLYVESKLPNYEPQDEDLCLRAPSIDADAGFGMAPSIVYVVPLEIPGRNVVMVGQKNGVLYCLNSDSGQTIWASNTGIYDASAKLDMGIATDGQMVYYTQQWQVSNGNDTAYGSAYGAADALSGRTKWVVPAPYSSAAYNPPTLVGDLLLTGYFDQGGSKGNTIGLNYGVNNPNSFSDPLNATGTLPGVGTGTNGTGILPNSTVPAGSTSTDSYKSGAVMALDKATGKMLKQLPLHSVFSGGLAVASGRLLFGTGDCWPDEEGSFYVAHVT